VENGVACNLAEGILSGVCFSLSKMGVEGAGGGEFIGEWGLLRCGVAVMEQVTRGSKHDKGRGLVLPAVGALQRGSGEVVVRMEAGTRAGGTSEWWGQ
jgi:hypothetical protein